MCLTKRISTANTDGVLWFDYSGAIHEGYKYITHWTYLLELPKKA
jgi:hypothetical protein